MSQREQYAMVQVHDIFVSLPGSDVMNALFLPVGSVLLTPCRSLDKKLVYGKRTNSAPNRVVVEHGNEMRIWFNAMPNLRCIQVCGKYDISFDTSKFMIPGSFNMTNFVHIVQMAVDEWKAQSRD